ncbi:ABC transporter substrate-binding protein [Lacticaseibacillus brantae]|uniref:NlpA lipoprotein n=1 Tax=Lacticaseibacillus brantae DSM 23927 TaxID=1423727 RepID=A0A0R2AW69_9LACO|nr:MetQ/NlpA family ABC transporter substrate-binding protein [Lacticaseibacillus brantae]KRM71640.1 NlpA lipoprotein [Lacticaseibacillus brantae DSM 23927]
MKKTAIFTALTVAIATLLVACAPKESAVKSSTSNNDATTQLTIGTMPAPDSLPLYVAQQEGLFKKQGLNVNLQLFKSPKDRDTAIAGGQLDGAVTDIIAFTSYVNGKLNWRIGSGLTGYFGIVTNDANVKTVKDLAGKSVAVQPRQTPQFYLYQQLQAAGVPANAVKTAEVAQIPVRLQVVEQKQVTATVLPDPFLSMAKAAGLHVLAQSNPKDYQSTILAFNKQISGKADVRKRFYKAYNQAVKRINAHKATDYAKILEQLGYPAKSIAQTKLPTYTKATPISDKMLGEAFNYAYTQQILKHEVDSESYQLPLK